MKGILKGLLRAVGYEIKRYQPAAARRNATKKKPRRKPSSYPKNFGEERKQICAAVAPYTMTNVSKLGAAIDAVEYVVRSGIEGAIVECGVWKGGSSMAMAMKLMNMNAASRNLYLYDTFSGMSAPTAHDVSTNGRVAMEKYLEKKTADDGCDWARSALEEVQENMKSSGYPFEKCHFVQGKVEDTIPRVVPEKIAILRLDTDWYESTKHEMTHLFPLLAEGGVLIVDDYGHWQGSKKAVDEYIAEHQLRILLHRIDYSCRVAVKT